MNCIVTPQPLSLAVGFNQGRLLVASSEAEVLDRLRIRWKKSNGCAVFWRHVRQCSALRQAEIIQTRAEELDELLHYTVLAEPAGES